MAAKQGRRSEALVVAGIAGIADPHLFLVEKSDDGGNDPVLRQSMTPEVAVDLSPDLGQRRSELGEVAIFPLVAPSPELGMVAILLAAPRIDPGRLEVAVGVRTEPGVGVGGGEPDGVQPVDLGSV